MLLKVVFYFRFKDLLKMQGGVENSVRRVEVVLRLWQWARYYMGRC